MKIKSLKEQLVAAYTSIFLALSLFSALVNARGLECSSLFEGTQNSRVSFVRDTWESVIAHFDLEDKEPDVQELAKALNNKIFTATLFGQRMKTLDIQIVDGKGLSLRPLFDQAHRERGIISQVRIGRKALSNPFQVTYFINQIVRSGVGDLGAIFSIFPEQNGHFDSMFSFMNWTESYANAAQGDRMSQLKLELADINARTTAFDIALNSDRGRTFQNVDKSEVQKAADVFNRVAAARILEIKAQMSELISERQIVLKNFKSSFSTRELQNLVAKNDRQGVANLFISNLPWQAFSPSENHFWKSFLKSVVKPSANKVLVYRGYNAESQPKNSDGQHYNLSRVFDLVPTDQVSDVIKRAFLNLRNHLMAFSYEPSQILDKKDRTEIQNLPPNLSEYMEGGFKLFSFNFSYDVELSWSFACLDGNKTYSMAAYLIDADRLMLNFSSPYTSGGQVEREIHTPFIIFPDEVVYYSEGTYEDRNKELSRFKRVVAQKIGAIIETPQQRDASMVQTSLARFARLITLQSPN